MVTGAHPLGERSAGVQARLEKSVPVDSFAGKVEVRWAPEEAVTPLGQLPFFVDFLKQADLFDPFVREAPLQYSSPNAPRVRDVLGTLLLSVVSGASRYAHVNALRYDGVNPGLLGMRRVCSDDSVRRAIGRMDAEEAGQWLRRHLDFVTRPLLGEAWILDIDTTLKPVYGRQEGAEVGYNPQKPGRPSQVIHVYEMSGTRLVLEAEVESGKRNHSMYGLEGLGRLLDGMRPEERPRLVRGDRGYGTERVIAALEARSQDYLFKLMMKPKVKDLVRPLAGQGGWTEAGQGWEAAQAELQLSGWTQKRKVVEAGKQRWEYSVLVTSLEWEPLTLAQLYRDRADTENAFDELKNQWGWGGFVTQDLNRTRIMVRLNALFYNWWSLFVRMIDLDSRHEARTSRPQRLEGVGRVTRHGRQTTLLLTIAHSAAAGLRAAFTAMTHFLRELQNAPQLTAVERWCEILARALRKYFRGRVPKPPPGLLPA